MLPSSQGGLSVGRRGGPGQLQAVVFSWSDYHHDHTGNMHKYLLILRHPYLSGHNPLPHHPDDKEMGQQCANNEPVPPMCKLCHHKGPSKKIEKKITFPRPNTGETGSLLVPQGAEADWDRMGISAEQDKALSFWSAWFERNIKWNQCQC